MENLVEQFTRQDRDTIIKVALKIDTVLERIDKLENNLVARVEALEKWQAWSKGLFVAAGLVATLIVYIYFSDIGKLKDDLAKHELETQRAFSDLTK